MFLWCFVREHLQAQPKVVLVYYISEDGATADNRIRDWESQGRTRDTWVQGE